MNIKFSVLAILLLISVVVAAQAQPAQTKTSLSDSPSSPEAGAAAGTAPTTQFPDERNILIHDNSSGSKATTTPVKSYGVWDFVQMLLILALVIAGIYLLFYFLKRAGGPRQQENQVIGLLSTKALAANRSLHLVEVGKQMFLVGSSESGVALVAEIRDKESMDEIRIKAAERGTLIGKRNFREVFSGMFVRGGSGAPLGAPAIDPFGFIRQQRERLKKM